MIWTILFCQKSISELLIILINLGSMIICINYGCLMKTEFLTNEVGSFPYSSDQAIVDAIIEV